MRRLHATIVDLLEELGNLRLESGNPTGALAAAEQALSLDPHNEAAHRVAMHAEAALGLRQAIVDRYERLRRNSISVRSRTGARDTTPLPAPSSQDARSHVPRREQRELRIPASNGIPVEVLI